MKIAHVTDFYLPRLGGIELHVADLSDRQRRQGHEVDVITCSPGAEGPGIVRAAAGLRRPHVLHPAAIAHGVRLALGTYDVVHVHAGIGSPLAFLSARACARAGIPTVVTLHSMLDGYQGLFRQLDRCGGWSRLPIIWTAVSRSAARPLSEAIGVPVGVLPNGIDQEHWRAPMRRQHSGPDVVVAAVMRLSHRKRPLPLLRMVNEAQTRLGAEIPLRLLVVGDGPSRDAAEKYVQQHRLANVHFLGRLSRPEIKQVLIGADLFLAPADLESFGIAALEARCVGLPVIAKREGGIGEFIRSGREGLLCDDDEQMVQAMVQLSSDRAMRQEIAEHNRTQPCPIDWASVLADTDQIYAAAGRKLGRDLPIAGLGPVLDPIESVVPRAPARSREPADGL